MVCVQRDIITVRPLEQSPAEWGPHPWTRRSVAGFGPHTRRTAFSRGGATRRERYHRAWAPAWCGNAGGGGDGGAGADAGGAAVAGADAAGDDAAGDGGDGAGSWRRRLRGTGTASSPARRTWGPHHAHSSQCRESDQEILR